MKGGARESGSPAPVYEAAYVVGMEVGDEDTVDTGQIDASGLEELARAPGGGINEAVARVDEGEAPSSASARRT